MLTIIEQYNLFLGGVNSDSYSIINMYKLIYKFINTLHF